MADKDDDFPPEIDPETRRPKVLVPLRRPGPAKGPVREISPEDINLGGGSRMIGRSPTYQKGGKVKSGSDTSMFCKGGKVISSRSW